MVSATTTSAAAEHVTDATALLAGEPTASPIVLGDLDVASALRSPVPLAPALVASSGPAAPVGEDAASPSASLTGFGSPIVSPSSTAAATTTALPDAAVLSNEKAELAEPDTTLPEEPCTILHAMAPAGPHESAMPALSPFGGTDPDSNTPGPAAVIAAGPPVNTSPVGPSADPSDQNAAPLLTLLSVVKQALAAPLPLLLHPPQLRLPLVITNICYPASLRLSKMALPSPPLQSVLGLGCLACPTRVMMRARCLLGHPRRLRAKPKTSGYPC
ncbi:TPA: hypothetical protein ACH3X3_004174 [Trebouxia sp. C0006]